ncbi:MAG: MFS transporter [Chitinophagaceae bacterium]
MENKKKIQRAWAMYDWANSVYNLVITSTIFPAYYVAVTSSNNNEQSYVDFFGYQFINTALQNYALAIVFFIVAFTSPILSSIADYRGNKKAFMRFFVAIGSFACAMLYFFTPENIEWGIIFFAIAALGFWSSLVFYNSYLPDIAKPEERDSLSARGFAMGYIGSVLLQLICFVVILEPDLFGLDPNNKTLGPRISFLLVGCWWLGFSQITFKALPSNTEQNKKLKNHLLVNGFHELKLVWNQAKEIPALKRYLFSFFLFSVGVQTVMLVAASFSKKEIFPKPEDEPKLIMTIILIQLVALIGAIIMSKLSKRIGNIYTLVVAVFIWIGICLWGYYIQSQTEFYILAACVGLVMGGIQTIGRSTYAKLIPVTDDTTSYFSFYDVTEKVALTIGLFLFARNEELTGSIRNSILILMLFFIFSFFALLYTKKVITKEKYASLFH